MGLSASTALARGISYKYGNSERWGPLCLQFHRDLIVALYRGTSAEADHAMRQYVRYGLNGVLGGISTGPGWPEELMAKNGADTRYVVPKVLNRLGANRSNTGTEIPIPI
jgi:hypothetical protein